MPMYDYGCDECGYTKEILTSRASDSEIVYISLPNSKHFKWASH